MRDPDKDTGGGGSGGNDDGGSGGSGDGGSGDGKAIASSSYAVGGCYDAFGFGCGIPADPSATDPPVEAGCATCSIESGCTSEDQACTDNAACDALRKCVAACGRSSCIPECTAQHPEGADAYRALLTCGYCRCDAPDVCRSEKAAADPPIVCP